ncbi:MULTISPECIES: hypothetical protein [unclassified Serratia (in: enterobacteria)]|uniref:hypothetical protein n=1 Tax=unclassified Serratia (in: enterobacteria) TaxID=2647522 RepID=UPI0018CEF91D|nr:MULTISPECIES: hypothetical protein [unclassified Serratia (in: enterobacteria)]
MKNAACFVRNNRQNRLPIGSQQPLFLLLHSPFIKPLSEGLFFALRTARVEESEHGQPAVSQKHHLY